MPAIINISNKYIRLILTVCISIIIINNANAGILDTKHNNDVYIYAGPGIDNLDLDINHVEIAKGQPYVTPLGIATEYFPDKTVNRLKISFNAGRSGSTDVYNIFKQNYNCLNGTVGLNSCFSISSMNFYFSGFVQINRSSSKTNIAFAQYSKKTGYGAFGNVDNLWLAAVKPALSKATYEAVPFNTGDGHKYAIKPCDGSFNNRCNDGGSAFIIWDTAVQD